MTAARKARDLEAEIAFLTRALKAPTLRESVDRLAARAREESWSHEEFLVACLQREVAARDSHGGEGRVRAARFPARRSLEEFDFDHARGLRRDAVAHLGTLDFIAEKGNVVFLGPPGTGKTHLATGIAIRACQAGHRVQFATASQWTGRLAAAHTSGTLQAELARLARYPLLVVDDIGLLPVGPDAAEGLYRLVDAAYERRSVAVSSNLHPSVFDELMPKTLATATVDRLIHHAHVCQTSGDSIRLTQAIAGKGVTPL
jgi:DNA replication protein DnaC